MRVLQLSVQGVELVAGQVVQGGAFGHAALR
jgi:hypothetical protein